MRALLDWGTRLGFVLLVVSFVAYVLGCARRRMCRWSSCPRCGTSRWPRYLQRTGTPTGWGWLALVHQGDIANLVGIALLAGCSLPPLLALLPLYLKQRDWAMATICLLEVAVILLAASGVLTAGH